MREGPRQNLNFERRAMFEVLDKDQLTHEQLAAVEDALAAREKSTDDTYQVGVAMVSEDGTMVWEYNRPPDMETRPEKPILDKIENTEERELLRQAIERSIRTEGHAEMRALSKLYGAIRSGEKRLKLIAMAGARSGEQVVRKEGRYDPNTALEDLEWMKPCAKCLEYIHDRTANVPDVGILSVAATGQIVKTSLRSLIPNPHTSMRIHLDHFMAPEEGHDIGK